MKLATFSPLPSGNPRPGLVLDGKRLVDIPAALGAGDDTNTMLGIIRAGSKMLDRLRDLEKKAPSPISLADVKLHAPIPRPSKNVFCVGWNYLEHFDEGAKKLQDNRELPKYPVFFSKAVTAVTGPFDNVPFDASKGIESNGPVTAVTALLKNTGYFGSSRLSCSFFAPSSKCSR